jgi:23S rRNA pseudouridine955/2504/2580 synthase
MKENFHTVSTYKVSSEYEGVRLDNCLISKLKGLPRAKIYSIIRKGEVRVNKSRCKPSYRLKVEDVIRIPPYTTKQKVNKKSSEINKDKVERSIIRKEKDFLIVNKPVGLACHGGSGISLGLIETIRQLDKRYIDAQLVHRIDKDTSGCLVVALKKSILREFHKEIRNKHVDKIYTAVVKGKWPEDLQKITLSIKKETLKSGKRIVKANEKGKVSETEFKLISSSQSNSLIRAKIITGRTHQIRVHSSHKGYPIVGDLKYGDAVYNKQLQSKGLKRMLLHAESINFKNLDIEQSAPIPEVFSKYV